MAVILVRQAISEVVADNTRNFMAHWQRQQLSMADKVCLSSLYMLFKRVTITSQGPTCAGVMQWTF